MYVLANGSRQRLVGTSITGLPAIELVLLVFNNDILLLWHWTKLAQPLYIQANLDEKFIDV